MDRLVELLDFCIDGKILLIISSFDIKILFVFLLLVLSVLFVDLRGVFVN